MKNALYVLLCMPSLLWAKPKAPHIIQQDWCASFQDVRNVEQNTDDIIVIESPYMILGSELIIYYSTGQELQRQKVTREKMFINTSTWPAATYFFVLSSNRMNTVISSYKVEKRN